jgi:hypothetical protein
MGDSKYTQKKRITPSNSQERISELEEEMTEVAGEAARNAADSLAQAVGAITVAFGLKAARPVAETAEDLGIVIGEALRNLVGAPDSEYEDVEVISVDFKKKS